MFLFLFTNKRAQGWIALFRTIYFLLCKVSAKFQLSLRLACFYRKSLLSLYWVCERTKQSGEDKRVAWWKVFFQKNRSYESLLHGDFLFAASFHGAKNSWETKAGWAKSKKPGFSTFKKGNFRCKKQKNPGFLQIKRAFILYRAKGKQTGFSTIKKSSYRCK